MLRPSKIFEIYIQISNCLSDIWMSHRYFRVHMFSIPFNFDSLSISSVNLQSPFSSAFKSVSSFFFPPMTSSATLMIFFGNYGSLFFFPCFFSFFMSMRSLSLSLFFAQSLHPPPNFPQRCLPVAAFLLNSFCGAPSHSTPSFILTPLLVD